ncbi:hypothetical protein F5Y18DRAFT_429601 [Xylariaceae sp. FL1019]|nr:hypothetical protein F5Y18DRAFT_429601 [Xylariaceae sp. FL1019]
MNVLLDTAETATDSPAAVRLLLVESRLGGIARDLARVLVQFWLWLAELDLCSNRRFGFGVLDPNLALTRWWPPWAIDFWAVKGSPVEAAEKFSYRRDREIRSFPSLPFASGLTRHSTVPRLIPSPSTAAGDAHAHYPFHLIARIDPPDPLAYRLSAIEIESPESTHDSPTKACQEQHTTALGTGPTAPEVSCFTIPSRPFLPAVNRRSSLAHDASRYPWLNRLDRPTDRLLEFGSPAVVPQPS